MNTVLANHVDQPEQLQSLQKATEQVFEKMNASQQTQQNWTLGLMAASLALLASNVPLVGLGLVYLIFKGAE